ncbi:polysaccharide deacetylase family protein [Microbacterium sp. CCH5-D1]|uniref:polysaccharide deacetylase family protein n=1 Tax=Microbacterium sp. CCH5-D1 TaxID=1768780 RepID=UPI000769D606|nr:polysaccharide deacetylase family protein [Microbacterium sp. CCH5-D1]
MTKPSFDVQREQLSNGHFIRVVNYHSTPRGARAELEKELAGFARDYAPVTLEDLDRLFDTGTWHKDKPGLIPVFYEGYRNSISVAAPLCDEYGLTGWFPIATSFVDCDPEHQEAFARAHWISLVEEDTRGGRIAMSWDEVAEVSKRHVVFPHTAHHEGFDTTLSDEDILREVVESKAQLEAVTGQEAPAFVWLHGSSYGQSPRHDQAVKDAGYRYQFANTMIHRVS